MTFGRTCPKYYLVHASFGADAEVTMISACKNGIDIYFLLKSQINITTTTTRRCKLKKKTATDIIDKYPLFG